MSLDRARLTSTSYVSPLGVNATAMATESRLTTLGDQFNLVSRKVAVEYAQTGWVRPETMTEWRRAKAAYYAEFDRIAYRGVDTRD